jgi:uracil phosphoribosyltransferase
MLDGTPPSTPPFPNNLTYPTSRPQALQTILPYPVPVHHLGLFREATTLSPVEYYNNLPYHRPDTGSPSNSANTSASELAILLDPVIATGGTCTAAIQTLREWGVRRVIVIAVLAALPGVLRAAGEWEEGVDIWIAGLDEDVNDSGMIKPGLGDVGDRLFLTIGK